jgi:predicted Rossmann fold nucleotide-binding protein DprA/Smf involved in DNA uptake
VLALFGLAPDQRPAPKVGPDAAAVLAALPGGADEIVRSTGLDAATVAVALAELELAGLVSEGDGLFRAERI